jgi:hypothetical protein
MPRKLNDYDLEILKKLAPELEKLICSGSGVEYRSLLPPVANHISRDEVDFGNRLSKLSQKELTYISDLALSGGESLGCLEPEYAAVFFEMVSDKLSSDMGAKLQEAYEKGEGCGF